MIKIKIGDIVQYQVTRDIAGRNYTDNFPAMVYVVYKGGEDADGIPVGLSVLFDGIPTRYGKIYYSEKPKDNHWSLIPNEL